MKVNLKVVLPILLATSFSAAAATVDPSETVTRQISEDIAARDSANQSIAPIRSADDLHAFIESRQPSALDALSPVDRAVFLQSIEFENGRVVSFDRNALRGLKLGQAYAVLALVGQQAHVAEIDLNGDAELPSPMQVPLKGYECLQAGQHTCASDPYAACTANC